MPEAYDSDAGAVETADRTPIAVQLLRFELTPRAMAMDASLSAAIKQPLDEERIVRKAGGGGEAVEQERLCRLGELARKIGNGLGADLGRHELAAVRHNGRSLCFKNSSTEFFIYIVVFLT